MMRSYSFPSRVCQKLRCKNKRGIDLQINVRPLNNMKFKICNKTEHKARVFCEKIQEIIQ